MTFLCPNISMYFKLIVFNNRYYIKIESIQNAAFSVELLVCDAFFLIKPRLLSKQNIFVGNWILRTMLKCVLASRSVDPNFYIYNLIAYIQGHLKIISLNNLWQVNPSCSGLSELCKNLVGGRGISALPLKMSLNSKPLK